MPLLHWNKQLEKIAWSSKLIAVELLLIFLYLLGLNLYWGLNQLPAIGDAPDYENMAFHLSEGNGLTRGYDERWIQPYLEQDREKYNYLQENKDLTAGYSAYRPPLQPLIMAGTYQIFGRNFWPMRLLNIIATLLSVIIAMLLCRKHFGVIPSWITAGLLLIDSRFVEFSHRLLTECWAALLACLLAYTLIQAGTQNSKAKWFSAGIIFGLAILVRTSFIFWLPFLLFIPLIDCTNQKLFRPIKTALIPTVLLFGGFIFTASPWFYWNCHTANAILPLGSHGWINLPVAYSDQIISSGGIFSDEYAAELKNETIEKPENWRSLQPIEREMLLVEQGKQLTIEWAQQNPEKLPYIFVKKVFSCFIYDRSIFSLLAVPFLFGTCYWIRSYQGKILLILIASQFIGVGLTWSTSGRFQVPIRPMFCVFVAIGIWLMLLCLFENNFINRKEVELHSRNES